MSVVTSFVLPVFNAADVIAETIDSILAQSDGAFELIVVDDGSTDDTPRILARYAARDERIRLITQPNSGITRALIAGCAAARGEYIARHDAGDWSSPNRLSAQRALLDRDREVVFVSCWTEFVGPEREPLFTARGRDEAINAVEIIDVASQHGIIGGPTSHPSVTFRRDAYEHAGGYRAEFYYGQDWDLWYRLGALGKFQLVPQTLYFARVDEKSISSASREAQRQLARLSHAALLARSRGESDAAIIAEAAKVKTRRRRLCARARGLYFIGEALRRNGDARARQYLGRAVRACPLHVKAWIRLAQTLVWKTHPSAS
jgi:glycosyltransferase involved in cell wall biosynthesis